MNTNLWQVVLTRAELPIATPQPPFLNALLDGRVDWLRQERLTDGTRARGTTSALMP